jgi:hypothetical protein
MYDYEVQITCHLSTPQQKDLYLKWIDFLTAEYHQDMPSYRVDLLNMPWWEKQMFAFKKAFNGVRLYS